MMKLKHWLILAGIAALGLFIFFARDEFTDVIILIQQIDWRFLLLIIPLQILSYVVRAKFYQSMFSYFGYRLSLLKLYRLNWVLLFVSTTVPSAGLSELSVLSVALRKYGVPHGKSSLVQLSKYSIMYVSYLLLLVFAVVALFVAEDLNRLAVYFVITMALVIVTVASVGLFTLYDRRVFNWLVEKARSVIDFISRWFRDGKNLIGQARLARLLNEFYTGFKIVMENRFYLKKPFLWSVLSNIADVLLLYVVFWSIGFNVNPGVVIITYALANTSGLLSVVPGNIGVFDAVMVAVLTALGVPLSVGVLVALLYRIFVKMAFLPIGFYYYIKQVNEV